MNEQGNDLVDRYVGIDLGGTNIKTGLLTAEGKVIDRESRHTESEGGIQHVVEQMADAVRTLCRRHEVSLEQVRGVGIGAPGPLDVARGLIVVAPNFPASWRNVPIRDTLRQALGGIPVALENDANVAAYGEYCMGAGRGLNSLVMLTLGTGIGCGIVLDGKMLRGATDTAGEFGHVTIEVDGRLCGCGRRGCLEAYCSATATVKRFREALVQGRTSRLIDAGMSEEDVTCRDIFDAAKGDALAAEIVDQTIRYLAIGCNIVVNVLDPDIIVLAGGMIAAGDFLLGPLEKYARGLFYPRPKEHTRLVFTQLGGDAGIIGAALCARNS
jgi:glucokinase